MTWAKKSVLRIVANMLSIVVDHGFDTVYKQRKNNVVHSKLFANAVHYHCTGCANDTNLIDLFWIDIRVTRVRADTRMPASS